MSSILVVEDDAVVRKSVSAVLRSAGHETLEAGDGKAGLDILNNHHVDLAIVDIWMPNVDGLNFLRQLPDQFRSIPIIMISGGGAGNTLEQATAIAMMRGASEVLFKPFEPDELLAAVDRLL